MVAMIITGVLVVYFSQSVLSDRSCVMGETRDCPELSVLIIIIREFFNECFSHCKCKVVQYTTCRENCLNIC